MPKVTVYGIGIDVAQGVAELRAAEVMYRVCHHEGEEMMETAE